MTLKDDIHALEISLLQPETRRSAARLDALLADDFREFGGSGRVYTKQDILAALPSEAETAYTMSEFEVKPLADGVVLATYRVSKIVNGQVSTSLRSSIWRKTGQQWQMVFHQGTLSP